MLADPGRSRNKESGVYEVMYSVGDRVEIIGGGYEEFMGVTGEVIAIDPDYGPYIYPDRDRPDGHGRAPFYWDSVYGFNPNTLRKIDDAI